MGALISRYLDAELNPAQRESVQDHLRICESCRDFYEVCARNDEIISGTVNAYFGEGVTQAVMKRVEAEIDSGADPRRRYWTVRLPHMLAAAAVLVSIFAGWAVVQNHRVSTLRDSVAWLREEDRSARTRARQAEARHLYQTNSFMSAVRDARHDHDRYRVAVREFAQNVPELSAAYITNGVTVNARFADGLFFSFYDIYRRTSGSEDYSGPLNTVRLNKPEFTDLTARPGKEYEYQFIGYASDGRHESLPVRVKVPQDAADGGWEISCLEVEPDNSAALLVVMRDGMAQTFRVAVGEPVGHPSLSADFTTGYTVARIEEGNETLVATFAWPQEDEDGKRLYDPKTGKVKVRLEQVRVSVRQNKRVILQGDRDDRVTVWRQGRERLPVGP